MITIQEEYLKERDAQEKTTLNLTGTPTTSLPYVDDTIECPISSTSQVPPQPSIFTRYKEIKLKNEALKALTYLAFWKQTATTQHRLLYAFDSEKGQFQMAFLEPKVSTPRGVEDYKASIFLVDTKQFHAIDQIYLHK